MYNQETELLLLEGILPHLEHTFIDVGAEKGTFALWLLARGFSGIVCEPLPRHAENLRVLAAKEAVKFLPCAIDAVDGERDLHIATDEQGRPLDYFHSLQPLEGDARVHHTTSVRVRCRSLSSLAEEKLIPATPGLLKIDTEGHDLHVLRGLGLIRPAAVMVEFFTEGIYHGWPDAHPDKLIAQARLLGYTHFVAVRRHVGGLERIDYCPLVIGPGEWGNLLFLRDEIFQRARTALRGFLLQEQLNQNARWAELAQACQERLQLIKAIQLEADKRLAIIDQLTREKAH